MVSEQEASRLGEDLTPTGAVRAGNAEGTIPEWTGGITQPPAGYTVGDHHPDPFAGDPILFTITAANADQYRDKLSAGQRAMLEAYPTYKMNVYPTRRSHSYPQRVYDAIRANATRAELVADGNGIRGAVISSPFPLPQSGLEVLWNHKVRYLGLRLERTFAQVTPQRNGRYTAVKFEEQQEFYYAREGVTPENVGNRFASLLQEVTSPPRLAGSILLVHETLDQVREPRQAWRYNPGQRRVRRAPNIAYDNPGTASDGLRTTDNFDLFNGAPDRYSFELLGRREMYVPYNAYKLHSDQLKVSDLVIPGHLNQDHTRYELHRVWVVEARLREGVSHIYSRRTLYVDEDSWVILLVDHYDGRGELWRVAEGHTINFYDVPATTYTVEALYDLQAGRYLALGLKNEEKMQRFNFDKPANSAFTPAGLRRRGRR